MVDLLVTPHRFLRCHHCGDSLRMTCILSRLTYCGQIIVIILMVTFNPESKDVHTASYYITLSTSNRLTLLHHFCMGSAWVLWGRCMGHARVRHVFHVSSTLSDISPKWTLLGVLPLCWGPLPFTHVSCISFSLSEVDWSAAALVSPTDSTGGVVWALAAQPVEAIKPGGGTSSGMGHGT